jgi:nickel transport protein
MKSFIRWGKTLIVVGGILLSSLIVNAAQVLALSTEQVIQRLRSVPVFTLANDAGSPLLAVPSEGESRNPIASVFITQQDAQTFLNDLKTRDPEAAQGIQVTPVPLAKIYEYEVNQNQQTQNEAERLQFAFIPDRQQVEAAKAVLQQSGQDAQQFRGVPLFVAKSGGEEGGYLTINQGEEQVIPMFFDRAELQALLDRLKQVQPNLASDVQVQVVNLEGVLQTLKDSDNQELNRIVLIPPQSSRDYIRSLQQQNPQGQGNQSGGQPAQPQAQPAQPQR